MHEDKVERESESEREGGRKNTLYSQMDNNNKKFDYVLTRARAGILSDYYKYSLSR
jgi:hypothetical protein